MERKSIAGSNFVFWLSWIFANGLAGWFVGYLENAGLQFAATLALTGIIVGFGQWLVLWKFQRQSWLWLVVSSLGWFIGSLLNGFLNGVIGSLATSLWMNVGMWEVFWLNVLDNGIWLLAFSVFQVALLTSVSKYALWWVPVSILAGMIKGGVSASMCYAYCQNAPAGALGVGLVVDGSGWLVYGIVTGLALILLVIRQETSEPRISVSATN